jgi:dipeptidase D
MVLENLKPKLVWSIFENIIAATPHLSYHEDRLRTKLKEYVEEKSKENNLDITILQDEKGNVLFRRPASKGNESLEPICLQAHFDMVGNTDLPDGFNFMENPIPLHIQDNNEWVDAIGTTVGGDDGIGLALAIALLVDPAINYEHGPLEVLATVEEEVGCIGGRDLGVEQLDMHTKYLINLDGTWTGTIGFGTAAGAGITFQNDFKRISIDEGHNYKFIHLSVSGLTSGHPGVEIHLPRANAIKILSRILTFCSQEIKLEIATWNGGRPSVIPDESEVIFRVKNEDYNKLLDLLSENKRRIYAYYQNQDEEWQFEPNMKINWKETQPKHVFSHKDSQTIISTINIIPHGPTEISPYTLMKLFNMYYTGQSIEVTENVTLSNNLSLVNTKENQVTITSSYRGNDDDEFEKLRLILKQIGQLANWNIRHSSSRPAWKSSKNTKFVQFIAKEYHNKLKRKPLLSRFHWGMETSYFPEKLPGVVMVTIGPTVLRAHSPDEQIHIPSVKLLYNILNDVFKNFKTLFQPFSP